MADYSNIQRVIIRKPVGLRDAIEAFKILQELNKQLDVIRFMAERQTVPKFVIDHDDADRPKNRRGSSTRRFC